MDIKDVKDEKLKIEFEIADIINRFEEKTNTTIININVNNPTRLYISEIPKTVIIGLDIN